jgi:hypothetical protein
LQPHRSRYWLNANPLNPEVFRAQAAAVCDLYEQAGQLAEQGIHVVSTDEKPGIQALERKYPDIPMGPGRVQGREHEYSRHGTLCLTANLEVWCGCIIAPTVGLTRTEQDFAAHVEQTVATDPFAGWVFIVDNLNTHQSETLVLYVARACGRTEDLGEKEKRGVLKSQESRAVPVGPEPPNPVRVHAEAQFVAEPDRNLVQPSGAETATSVQFPVVGRPQEADSGLHRLLQPDHVQAHQVALLAAATSRGDSS